MKLPIKKKYFDQIKSGEKIIEYRDAHITFICEETRETLLRSVYKAEVVIRQGSYPKLLSDEHVILFHLEDSK